MNFFKEKYENINDILVKIFSVNDFFKLSVINFAVPSAVFKATFPVNPSVTNTFELPDINSLPSTYPLNMKLFSLFKDFNLLYAFLSISVPLISSDPTFNKATFGFSLGSNALYKADPSSAKSTKLSSLHSILAPKSKTTLIPFSLGHRPAKAGLLTSSIIFKIIRDITRSTPVLPADKLIFALPSI